MSEKTCGLHFLAFNDFEERNFSNYENSGSKKYYKENKTRSTGRIPIFYAVDDRFIKYMIVSVQSIIENADQTKKYVIYVLNSGVSNEMRKETEKLKYDRFDIRFVDVKRYLEKMAEKLPIRDYYSKTTYYRLFIADMFPEYEKAVYIDSDTVVLGDVAKLYETDLGENYVGACHEQVMIQTEVYGNYVEKVMGISRHKFFNAGVLLLNCKAFRENRVLNKFMQLLNVYTFVVTQDEDYLNVLCQGKVFWLDQSWNTQVYGEIPVAEKDIKILHYIMVAKPWRYVDCRLKEYFWEYAKKTSVYGLIRAELASYTNEERARDARGGERLAKTAREEANRLDTYLAIVTSGKNPNRLKVQEKIRVFEREARFDEDVEEDPPTKELLPDKVDYLHEKFSTRLKTRIANFIGDRYFKKMIKDGVMVIDGVEGEEYLNTLEKGTVITCNHFSIMDNYILFHCIRNRLPKKYLHKIIREGNYTNFPGLLGFLLRYCNTLPLSSNRKTMMKFLSATDTLLKSGESILIYPEQGMWWNYRKPRPLKVGGFKIAYRSGVPVLPIFISMADDAEKLDADGYPLQRHTLHVMPPIYPDLSLGEKLGAEKMKQETYAAYKRKYEQVYGEPLTYGEAEK